MYFLATLSGLKLLAAPQIVPIFWLPSAILITVLWVRTRGLWPYILCLFGLIGLLGWLAGGFEFVAAACYTATSLIESVLIVLLVKRFLKPVQQFITPKKLGLLALSMVSVYLLTALLAATFALLIFKTPFFSAWITWFMANSLGTLLLMPIVIIWVTERPSFKRIGRELWLEAGIVLVFLALVTWFVFYSNLASSGLLLSMPYLAYPFIFWAAFRLGVLGAASASILLVAINLLNAMQGYGPFISTGYTSEYRIFTLQVFLITSTVFAWLVAALFSERSRTEQARQASEKRFRSILQNAPVFMAQIDPSGKLVFSNWSDASRPTPDSMFAPLLPQSYTALKDAISATSMNANPWQAELAAQSGTKNTWFEVRLNPILADGKVESLILIATEITERKLAAEALRNSEERFSVAVRGANDGIWDWDLLHNRIYFSQRWKKMIGYSEGEISDSPDEWLGRVHPDDIQQVRDDLKAHQMGYTPHFISEHRIMHRGGAYRWILVRGLAVRSAKGKEVHRLAGSLTDITARKTTEERLLHDAMHDLLTGIPNRAYFLDQLNRSIQRIKRHNAEYWNAVLFIDLDRFKLVNESFGHLAGDTLLIEVAHRLECILRPQDTVARFSGDEFAILLEDINSEEDAIQVADRVQSSISKPFSLQNGDFFTSVSIGIVVNPGTYEHAEDLLRDVDTALYEAKANGRARYQTFDAKMRLRSLTQLQMEADLRHGLERGEFEVFYQPIVSLPDGTITSCEALVRWHHPERGLLFPADFIPAAHESGLIEPINNWVIRTACRQLKEWLIISPHLQMSVNLTIRQLQDPTLPEQFAQILAESELNGSSLQLEVTESAAMEDLELTISILNALKGMGLQIALDDFGMRSSSLDYLNRFPVNTIKIDKSFIWDISEEGKNATITRAIISVGHLLKASVVAEGVETHHQLDFLHLNNCDSVQGYLYSEAQNVNAITAYLERSPNLVPTLSKPGEEADE